MKIMLLQTSLSYLTTVLLLQFIKPLCSANELMFSEHFKSRLKQIKSFHAKSTMCCIYRNQYHVLSGNKIVALSSAAQKLLQNKLSCTRYLGKIMG